MALKEYNDTDGGIAVMWIVKLIMGLGFKVKLYAGILATVAVTVAIKTASVMKSRQAKKELKDYVDTRKDVDEAQRNADRVDDDEWLRGRIDKRDL